MEFSCNPAQQCLSLSTSVQYQCIVTDSNILLWRIRNENSASLETVAYATGSNLVTTPVPFPNSLPFFTDYTSKSPSLISNISFTVQSSINGYTIHCEDGDGNMENYAIEIAGDCGILIKVLVLVSVIHFDALPSKSEELLIVGSANIEWNKNNKSVMV